MQPQDILIEKLKNQGISNLVVLAVIRSIPRERFLPANLCSLAYENVALPIGYGQTISQPFIVALMTILADLTSDSIILEIGTGSGYQAAVLAKLACTVYSIEIIPQLAQRAQFVTKELGYTNIFIRSADGHEGWLDHAPYDAILVTAAATRIPENLIAQLNVGGRLIIPLATTMPDSDVLIKVIKTSEDNRYTLENILDVRFLPFI